MLEQLEISNSDNNKENNNVNNGSTEFEDNFKWPKASLRNIITNALWIFGKKRSDGKIIGANTISNTEQDKIAIKSFEESKLEEDLIGGMDKFRASKKEKFRSERTQELSERSFNEHLTKLEDIEATSQTEDNQVSKREIEYNGKKLTVYDFEGFPFSFFQHAIDYKGRGQTEKRFVIGAATAKSLQDNPSLWQEKKSEIPEFGGYQSDSQSNTLSVSYVNLEINPEDVDPTKLYYGFDHLEPDSVLMIGSSDVMAPNDSGDQKTFLNESHPYLPEMLEDQNIDDYNEISLRRYKENGDPKMPDYLIVVDGNMSEVILRHAAYFNIPIINIETKYYKKQESKAA